MNKEEHKELLHKLRLTYSDNGSGYNSDFTLTLQKAADLIEELTQELNLVQYKPSVHHWLIRKEPGTKDTYFVAEGTPPDNVLAVYGIVKGKV
jgi:hypothetical protein